MPLKRAFDLLISLAIAPVAIPVCLITAAAIWLECRASPFFWQTRLGKEQAPFKLLKIRTMAVDTIDAGSHEIGRHHILKTGRLVRATKIDELPQIWNVLKGEMSLVGPRPGLPVQEELTLARQEFEVFDMLPGITGVSQIAGVDMSVPWQLAKLDATYAGKWRLSRDLQILFHTISGKGRGDAATKNSDASC